MRLAVVAIAALSLAACSKTNAPAAADSTAAPAAAGADAPASTATATPAAMAPAADATGGGNAAIKAPHPENAGPTSAGANSFTEGQARGHIENSGYSNVSGLAQDANGVWHGKAMKDGQSHDVSLDFKGNVVSK